MDETYGKYGEDNSAIQIIMEFNQMFPYILDYAPFDITKYPAFVEYLSQDRILE